MLTDANKSTLDLLALNLCDERRQGRWAEGAKVDLAEWDWRKPPPRCATMIPLDVTLVHLDLKPQRLRLQEGFKPLRLQVLTDTI